jgi:cytochrome c553
MLTYGKKGRLTLHLLVGAKLQPASVVRPRRWMKIMACFGFLSLACPAFAQAIGQKLVLGCVPCHGADGIAKFTEVPNLAGQNELYLLNQLHAFHAGKRVHKEMDYMARKLTEEEMEAVAAYFAALPPR